MRLIILGAVLLVLGLMGCLTGPRLVAEGLVVHLGVWLFFWILREVVG